MEKLAHSPAVLARLSRSCAPAIAIAITCGLLLACSSAPEATTNGTDYRIPIVRGLEHPPPGELEHIAEIVSRSASQLKELHCAADPEDPCCRVESARARDLQACAASPYRPSGLAGRDAHRKHHGCVRARFTAVGSARPWARQGVFAPGSDHAAIVRFSNSSAESRHDAEGDGRGMAIKLLGVAGEKLLDRASRPGEGDTSEERQSQDFLLIDHPVFFVPDAATYASFVRASLSGSALRTAIFFALRLRLLRITQAITGKDVYSPLEISYHSMAPSLLGPREPGQAVKYVAEPVHCDDGQSVTQRERPREAADYLRRALVDRLAPGEPPACFDFAVEVRRDPRLPVEDPTRLWPEDGVERVTVARLSIPAQRFDTAASHERCENMTYTPWHSLPEHQPLGGLNRVRLEVYRAITELRHTLNRAPRVEPEPMPHLNPRPTDAPR